MPPALQTRSRSLRSSRTIEKARRARPAPENAPETLPAPRVRPREPLPRPPPFLPACAYVMRPPSAPASSCADPAPGRPPRAPSAPSGQGATTSRHQPPPPATATTLLPARVALASHFLLRAFSEPASGVPELAARPAAVPAGIAKEESYVAARAQRVYFGRLRQGGGVAARGRSWRGASCLPTAS